MATLIFGKRGVGSGPIKAPCSMPARIFIELQRNGLGYSDNTQGQGLLLPGIHIKAEAPPPLLSLAGMLFRLNHHPAHLAGHYPHSNKTAGHVVTVDSPQLATQVSEIFSRWPRVRVECARPAVAA